MLTTFRIFVDLVEGGSFSRAAEANYLTPSAVSQRIRQLEERLGQRLLNRSRAGVTPTDAGEIVFRASRDVLARYEELRRELESFRDDVTGRLRLGAITSVGLHSLPPYLKMYLERYPAVDVALEYLTSRDIHRGVLDRSLDLGIVAYPRRVAGILATPFDRDDLVVITPPEHRLARAKSLTADRLHGEPFVGFAPGIPTGRVIERLLRKRGARVRIVHRFDNVETLKRAVEVGAGLAIVPSATVDQEVTAGTLVRIRLRGDDWSRPIAVLQPTNREPGRAARAFIEVLME